MDRVSDQINNDIECLTLVLVSHIWFYVRIFGKAKLKLVILFHWNMNNFSTLWFKVNVMTFWGSLTSRLFFHNKWLGFFIDFYSDTIPFDGVPSYKGHAVKYSYKITVGTSRVQGQSKLLRLPIRILVLQGWYQYTFMSICTVCQINTLSNKTTQAPLL